MTQSEFLKIYWKHYCLLEKELLETDEYVSIDRDNFQTFSASYMNLLFTICSELDTIAGMLCKKEGEEEEDKVPFGIKNKLALVVNRFPFLYRYRVDTIFPYEIMNITPMVKFSDSVSDWWQAYNDVKHRRTEKNTGDRYNYTKANLKNVLNALAALYIFNKLMYENCEDSMELEIPLESKLFDCDLKL